MIPDSQRYKNEVIGRLHGYQEAGMGKVVELCETADGVPLVGFRGRGEPVALITGRHHSPDAFESSIYRLIEGGASGFFAVPVMDVRNYGAAQDRREYIDTNFPGQAPTIMYEVMKEKGEGHWGSFPVRNWEDYWRYGQPDAAVEARAVQSIIEEDGVRAVLDLHGSLLNNFFFLGHPNGRPTEEAESAMRMISSLEGSDQKVSEGLCKMSMYEGFCGFYRLKGNGPDILSYAASRNRMNLAVCVPMFRAGQFREYADGEKMAGAAAGALSSAIESAKSDGR